MSDAKPRARADAATLLLVCSLCYALAYIAWELSIPGRIPRLIMNFAFVPAGIPATFLAWRAGAASADAAVRRAWQLLALGCLFYWAGDVAWAVSYALDSGSRLTRSADYLYLLSYPITLLGLLRFTSVPSPTAQRVTFWLDAATVMLAGGMVSWRLVADAPVRVENPGEAAILIAYPIGDLVLILGSAVAQLRSRDERLRLPLLLLVVAFALRLLNDAVFGALTLRITLLDLSAIPYMLAWATLAGAGYTHQLLQRQAAEATRGPGTPVHISRIPYLALVLGFAVLLDAALRDWSHALGGLIVGSCALGAVVVLRQFLAARENLRLLSESAARAVETRLRSLLEGTSDLIVVLDAGGIGCWATRWTSSRASHSSSSCIPTLATTRRRPCERSHWARAEQRGSAVCGGATVASSSSKPQRAAWSRSRRSCRTRARTRGSWSRRATSRACWSCRRRSVGTKRSRPWDAS